MYSGWLVENNQLNLSKPLDRAMKAVANIGINPTTDITTSQKFEVHVLNRNDLELIIPMFILYLINYTS